MLNADITALQNYPEKNSSVYKSVSHGQES